MTAIVSFKGYYYFLSNFYPSTVEFEGLRFGSVEAAFQAAKTLDLEERKQFVGVQPQVAKHLGRRNVVLRPDWEDVKVDIMRQLVLQKFSRHPDLKAKLLATGNAQLVEGNNWHDNIWGNCGCAKCSKIEGQNNLGKILMEVRDLLK